jgi:hypothetical protein
MIDYALLKVNIRKAKTKDGVFNELVKANITSGNISRAMADARKAMQWDEFWLLQQANTRLTQIDNKEV